MPIIFLGAAFVLSFTVSGTGAARNISAAERDIQKLLNAAGKRDRAWEWRGAVPEVAKVARYGKTVAPKLLKLLEHPEDSSTFSHIIVDQQIQLVLCSIFDEKPDHGRTIYFVRTSEAENRKVKAFWTTRVEKFVREGE
jgi:hypothetical protein